MLYGVQIPGFALYLLWVHILQPYVFTPRAEELASDGIPENESRFAKRKRERAERKQQMKGKVAQKSR